MQVVLEIMVEPVFYSNYWDGPLSGLVIIDGKLCYFDNQSEEYRRHTANDQAVSTRIREFYAWILTDSEAEIEMARKKKFEDHVGHHYSFENSRKVANRPSYTADTFHKYYSERKSMQNFDTKARQPDYAWVETC